MVNTGLITRVLVRLDSQNWEQCDSTGANSTRVFQQGCQTQGHNSIMIALEGPDVTVKQYKCN